jgi:hypothetical protein
VLLPGHSDGASAIVLLRSIARRRFPILLMLSGILGALLWLLGSQNPYTPAGYIANLTKGAVFGKSRYYGVQSGPTSPGRTWLLDGHIHRTTKRHFDPHNIFAGHGGVIDVVNVNDCIVGEPETIATNAMTSVPPVSGTDTGFPSCSTSTRLPALTATTREGKDPPPMGSASTVMTPSVGTTRTNRHT